MEKLKKRGAHKPYLVNDDDIFEKPIQEEEKELRNIRIFYQTHHEHLKEKLLNFNYLFLFDLPASQ